MKRKTGEHLFADCGGVPKCVTCGCDEDDAYVGGEACTFKAQPSPSRRIKQLERCLSDVLRICSDIDIDLNARGADNNENHEYRNITRIRRRIDRTLPINGPYGLHLDENQLAQQKALAAKPRRD